MLHGALDSRDPGRFAFGNLQFLEEIPYPSVPVLTGTDKTLREIFRFQGTVRTVGIQLKKQP